MKYLLDTDHISILQKQSGPEYSALLTRLAQVPRADLAFCIVSFHEQVLGCHTYIARAKTSTDILRGYEMFPNGSCLPLPLCPFWLLTIRLLPCSMV